MSGDKKRVAVLISGRGSNMMALVTAAADPDYPAEISLVISDQNDAGGLVWAHEHDISAMAIERAGFTSRSAHEDAIHQALLDYRIQLVCLAGYMRILTAGFTNKWQRRMLNIHPSLLPEFPGLNTHQRAIEAGVSEHGCTVHFVTRELDAGPVVAQAKIEIFADDNEETLAARVLEQEHRLYPGALAKVARGEV